MTKVFIAQDPPPVYTRNGPVPKDLSSAARYGTLEFVFPSHYSPSADPADAIERAVATFERGGFDPDTDYVAYAGGDPLALPVMIAALHRLRVAHVSFLRWEKDRDAVGNRTGRGFYVPVNMPLEERTTA